MSGTHPIGAASGKGMATGTEGKMEGGKGWDGGVRGVRNEERFYGTAAPFLRARG